MHYRWMNRGDRIEAPLVKRGGGELQAVDWDEALERVATVLRGGASGKAVALVSPRVSTEALVLARERLHGLDRSGAGQIVTDQEPSPARGRTRAFTAA